MSRNRLYVLVLALSIAGYGWIGWNGASDGWSEAGDGAVPTPCLVRQVTGLPCPSCGTTRSIEAVAAGDIGRAAATNPFGIPLAAAMVVFPAWVAVDLVRRRDGFHRFYLAFERTLRERRPAAVAGATVVLTNWGWNILKGL